MNSKNDGKLANTVASVLRKVLVVEANTNSCMLFHQPKAPIELKKFSKKR